MPEFKIRVTADAAVEAYVTVHAHTRQQAETDAVEQAEEGRVEWRVRNVDVDSVDVG